MAKNEWSQHHDGVQVKDGQRQEGRDQVGKGVEQTRMTVMVSLSTYLMIDGEDEVHDIDHACDGDDQFYDWGLLYDEEGWVRDEGQVYDDEADLTLFNLILKCNQTLTKHTLSKDRTQGKEGHDGAEVQVKDEEDKVH